MSSIFFYDFDRCFDDALSPRHFKSVIDSEQNPNNAARSLKPRMDIYEDKEKNLVTASFDFPGVARDNIRLDVQNGKLTVSAETKVSSDYDEKGYAVRERRFGKFSRTLQLPQGIKDDEIKASMESGVLTVTFPKSTPELAPKRITVL